MGVCSSTPGGLQPVGKEHIAKERLEAIKELLGSSPKVKVDEFDNWASTQRNQAVLSVTPESVQEVQAVVRAAQTLQYRVRAVGKGHSWTPLFGDENEIVMHMNELKRPDGRPQIELNSDKSEVTLATSATTGEFMEFQLKNDICLPTNTIIRDITIGGAVTAACHGVGRTAQTISDYVTKMRVVNSDGDLKEYSMKEDPDMMRAVQCSLGLWGILIDVTLKVEPMIIVETENRWLKLKDIFYNQEYLADLVSNNWSVEIFWLPFTSKSHTVVCIFDAVVGGIVDCNKWDPGEDEVFVRIINPVTNADPNLKVHKILYEMDDFLQYLAEKGFDVFKGIVTSNPKATPAFLKHTQVSYLKSFFENEKIVQQLPHAVHYLNAVDEVPVYDCEWAFIHDSKCANVMQATKDVIKLLQKEALKGRFPANLPVEMRFIADSNIYMSPAAPANPEQGGSGYTCYIEVLTIEGTEHWDTFSRDLGNAWRKLPGARPHWAKSSGLLLDEDIKMHKGVFAKQMPKFISALERSKADPNGIFFNSYLEKIFYPKGHPSKRK